MQLAHALKRYTDALRTIQGQAQATGELSYHHVLLQLLRELDPNAKFVHEPKRVVIGRPDFILLKNGAPAGYTLELQGAIDEVCEAVWGW